MESRTDSPDAERRVPDDAETESTLVPAAGPMRCAPIRASRRTCAKGRCEKPICPRCLIQTLVGARCRDCAQLRKLPMFDVRPLDYPRAIGGGLAASASAVASPSSCFAS